MALLMTRDWSASAPPPLTSDPTLLLPVLGKPLLFHVIEALLQAGEREFHFLGPLGLDPIQQALGDGSRWGSRFSFHSGELGVAAALSAHTGDTPTLVVDPWLLPAATLTPEQPTVWRIGERDHAGWARAPLTRAAEAARGFLESGQLHVPGAIETPVEYWLDVRTWNGYLAANRLTNLSHYPSLLLPGREVEPGVWISRNVEIHPAAVVTPPVFLGEGVRIGRGAQVGPNAVLHDSCILSPRSHVRDSVVASSSYIGEELDLHNMVVFPGHLWNAELGVEVDIPDAFLLGDLRTENGITGVLGRWLGGLRRFVTWR